MVWGGAARLSPADDLLIRVERPLELDAPGQLEAGVELVTCNTIPHPSNRIDVLEAIPAAVERRMPAGALAEAATVVR